MNNFVNVEILPYNKKIKVKIGTILLDVIRNNGFDIFANCGGTGVCGKCKVSVIKDGLSLISEKEKEILSEEELKENITLSCMRKVMKDTIIKLTENEKYIPIKNSVNLMDKKINSIINKSYLELKKPTLEDPVCQVDRILREFDNNISIDLNLICTLPEVLSESDYKITATILDNEIINIQKGNVVDFNYGIAIDLGTTTVAGYLINLNSGQLVSSVANSNKQVIYGGDVITRINYASKNKDNLEKLKHLAIETIDIIIKSLLEENNLEKDSIGAILILGNTTMSHLLIGANPKGIGVAPFSSVFSHTIKGSINYLGLKSLNDTSRFILLPNIAGYVGSDTLGVAISTDIINKKGNHLIIDIGTNCEILLKTEDKIYTCSTAAGPTFEGTNMECGIRARPGAVYSYEINETVKLNTIENKKPIGICGSGYIDIVSKLLDLNIINKRGRIEKTHIIKGLYNDIEHIIEKTESGYKIILDKENNIYISQNDISNLQLAKGAIKAGIEIMLKEAQVQNLDSILLAGAFGSSVSIEGIRKIKMIPNIDVKIIDTIGNAAGSGGMCTLLYKDIYESLINIRDRIEHINLASHEKFNSIFAKAIMF